MPAEKVDSSPPDGNDPDGPGARAIGKQCAHVWERKRDWTGKALPTVFCLKCGITAPMSNKVQHWSMPPASEVTGY